MLSLILGALAGRSTNVRDVLMQGRQVLMGTSSVFGVIPKGSKLALICTFIIFIYDFSSQVRTA